MWKKRFREKMQAAKQKKIVVYGQNNLTCEFLEYFPEYHIIGVIDDKSVDDMVQGIPLMSWDEAVGLGVEIVILVKQLMGDRPVFWQLLSFCKEKEIFLYDIYGNDLSVLIDKVQRKKSERYQLTEQKLCAQTLRYDIISFDIFDTLLMRKTLFPEDVFMLIGEKAIAENIDIRDFKNVRIKAQLESGLYNPDIYEIYDSLQKITGITDEQKRRLLSIEIETEEEQLIPRKDMVRVLRNAKEQGKKIVLVSDMYLPGLILERILAKNGISDYDMLCVSCDYKRLKNEGLLLEILENGKERTLHIGDSYINDGICAEMVGVDFCLILSAYELMLQTNWHRCVKELMGINDRSLLGLCISRIFNNPFSLAENDGECVKNIRDFGYAVVGALITAFLVWGLEKLKNSDAEKILFASRDGYILKKLYDYIIYSNDIKNMPEALYFYTSRSVAVMADMANEDIIDLLVNISKDLEPVEMMISVFGLNKEDVLPYEEENFDSLHAYVWAHREKIFKRAKTLKRNYYKYMGDEGLRIGGKYVFFDFVSSGTCQKSLLRYVPFEMDGLYFAWNNSEDKCQYNIETFCDVSDSYFLKNYKLIELFMTSEEPSLSDIDSDGKPVFAQELRTKNEIKKIQEVHEEVLHFGREYFKNMYIASEGINHKLPNAIFSCIGTETERKLIFSDFQLIDDWKRKLITETEWHETDKIESQVEFSEYYVNSVPERLEYEKELAQECVDSTERSYMLRGFCEVCGEESEFCVDFKYSNGITPNFRERLVCPKCKLNNRQRYIVSKVLKNTNLITQEKIYLYEKVTPVFNMINRRIGNHRVLGSEYISEQIESGTKVDGILHEDAEKLSFEDDSFDAIVSCDVFEHFNDYGKCFREAARILRSGGKMYLSVPFNPAQEKTLRRAEKVDGKLIYYKDPIYHAAPIKGNDLLVYWDFGWDILDELRNAGFKDAYMEPYYSKRYGYLGEGLQYIFVATKAYQ